LRIVGGTTIDLPGVDVERFEWTEASEVPLIQECDIGIMPLIDSPWERGKCGYKLIQYMACAKPVVASPVGVNQRIVEHGVNGWLARSTQDWTQAFTTLLSDPDLRMRMGKAGRDKVERDYTLQANAPRLEKLLSDAAGEV
jgi:glycosyltransferase involved in cell wall biosynthesis